jgi:hypothetical protein
MAAGSTWRSRSWLFCVPKCLNRRIAGPQTLKQEVAAWLSRRNANHAKADWRFATAAARIKLKRVYPIYPAF